MTTPNINIDVLMPVTYTGRITSGKPTFVIDGKETDRPAVPFSGQVMVQIVAGTKKPVLGFAHAGGYSYAKLAESTGQPYQWRCMYSLAVSNARGTAAYPAFEVGVNTAEEEGKPIAITFFPMGEHKN